MRKFFSILLVLFFTLGGIWVWRRAHPKLSDQQKIAANLDAICEAAKARSSRGITDYLSKDFKSNGIGKKDFQNSLVAGMLQYRVIDLDVSGVQNSVKGETARSQGTYTLSLKSEYDSPPQITRGKFDLQWRKVEGEWKISGAQGDIPVGN